MWNVILNSSYTSSYIINVDQNKKRKQSPRMRRRDCNLPLIINYHCDYLYLEERCSIKLNQIFSRLQTDNRRAPLVYNYMKTCMHLKI